MFWRKKKITDDLKAVAEVASEQIAPGAGTLLLALGAVAVVGAAAYVVSQKRKSKSARAKSALPKPQKG
jgi:hypothetical protein